MVSVYKGKGDALDCGSYRGIKLLEHVMKLFERIIGVRIRAMVCIDSMQFGFMKGRGTTDAIFIVRQLQEKYLAKNRDLWMAFIDLEKAFDRVPRMVIWWALQRLGVEEWLVGVVKSMYENSLTRMKIEGRESEEFSVKVGVHQGSVLSPLLFVVVMEALSLEFREGLPMELLYADDLILMAESREKLVERIKVWKDNLEGKGLRVNVGKSKVMRCHVGDGQPEASGKFPCAVCKKGVGANSIQCVLCNKWVHKRCSGIVGSLKNCMDYHCRRCTGVLRDQEVDEKEIVIDAYTGDKIGCVDKFSYLGDVLGKGGGAEEASRNRVRCAWAKFNELAPFLKGKGPSMKVKGRWYSACVQRALIYGSSTWPMKVEDMKRLTRAERSMVRLMCCVGWRDGGNIEELYKRLNIVEISEMVSRERLGWFGHVMRSSEDEWISRCRNFECDGVRGRGRSRKTWEECNKKDLKDRGLKKGEGGVKRHGRSVIRRI